MANNKTGFAFYNTDTDRYQDIKIKRLKKEFGCDGIAVYDYILCEIYRVKGCFYNWGENEIFDVSEYFGLSEERVTAISNYCSEVGLFDKKTMLKKHILTSASIQRRFLEMCERARRINSKIPEECLITTEESPEMYEESIENECSLPQSRVEKSIVEYIPPNPLEGETSNSLKIDFQKLGELFNELLTPELPKITLPMPESRKSPIRARVKEYGKEKIIEMFHIVQNSPHLLGHNDRGWKASFDWLFKPTNFIKVIEGNYLENKENGQNTTNQFTTAPQANSGNRPHSGRNDATERRASLENLKKLSLSILQDNQPDSD